MYKLVKEVTFLVAFGWLVGLCSDARRSGARLRLRLGLNPQLAGLAQLLVFAMQLYYFRQLRVPL